MKQGIDSVLTANVDLMMGGQSTTSTKLSAELAEEIALFQAVDDAAAALATARQSLTARLPEMRERSRELRTAMEAQLGSHNPELTKFWIVPPKARRALTTTENAIKTAKGRKRRR